MEKPHIRATNRLAQGVVGVLIVVGLGFGSFGLAAGPGAGGAFPAEQTVNLHLSEQACLKTGANPSVCPQEGLAKATKETEESFIKPALSVALITGLLELTGFALDRLAYESAVWLASGGKGQTPLFGRNPEQAWKSFGLDIAGEAIGFLSEDILSKEFEIEFNLCRPNDYKLNLGIAIGLRQAFRPQAPRCDFRDIQANWHEFLNTARAVQDNPSKYVLAEFAKGLRPGQNELSAGVLANLLVTDRVQQKKQIQFADFIGNEGYGHIVDIVTGNVKTPASLYKKQIEDNIVGTQAEKRHGAYWAALFSKDTGLALLSRTTSVFTNTLFSTLLQRIYDGLIEQPAPRDPFNPEIPSLAGQNAADQFISLIKTKSPIAETEYDVLSEFIVCPSGSTIARGINNCVIDQDLFRAITSASSGIPLTVGEAIEQGALHRDWILIPPSDAAQNQDPLCFNSAYCYGNLVKLRKARILPVGWELAALQNASRARRATLGEIVEGFNDCNDQNVLDRSHPFCHLIDPNWVIKYPITQCRATATGEILVSQFTNARASSCVDTPSCINENPDGSCGGGYGYCVREKNAWRFRGDECPAQYATCLSFNNSQTNDRGDWLLNTVDYSVCGQDNAGCRWYRTNKYLDDAGTETLEDDRYRFLPEGETYVTAERDDDIRFANVGRDTLEIEGVARFAYEDRLYLTHAAQLCVEKEAGCTQLYRDETGLSVNIIGNPSFEQDEDESGVPDFWQNDLGGGYEIDQGTGFFGERAVAPVNGQVFTQKGILLSPNSFYTFSLFARQASNPRGLVGLTFRDAQTGSERDIGLENTSHRGQCRPLGGNTFVMDFPEISADAYKRYSCTFTTTSRPLLVDITLSPGGLRYDGLQLEPQEQASNFTIGYNTSSPQSAFLKVPPSYLGCTGRATDPKECADYAQVCSAQQAGCELYTPQNGEPSIPAVLAQSDQCPNECVGYDAFKQEATKYEQEVPTVFFIPTQASSCSAQFVGCDSFTNLDSVEGGGEQVEFFTDLRACAKPEDDAGKTFFTWEGSDAAGYQLKTWQLLESEITQGTTIAYTQDSDRDGVRDVLDPDDDNNPNTQDLEIFDDRHADTAPCVNWRLSDDLRMICVDAANRPALEASTCNQHADILSDPDCREFYDGEGHIHYRRFSEVVPIDAACRPYRKTASDETNCRATGGAWLNAGECRYFGLAAQSAVCPASANGCRAYTGGAGRNSARIFNDDFEEGTTANIQTIGGARVFYSNESVAADGHSLRLVTRGIDQGAQLAHAYMPGRAVCTNEEGCDLGVCRVFTGKTGCGPLVNQIVPGKTYLLEFWAKGSGSIRAAFIDEGGESTSRHFFGEAIELTQGWQRYKVGPLDSSQPGFERFDEHAVLAFITTDNTEETTFIDNISLKQAEENVTIVKDSWVVPSTCDQAPNGTQAPQFFLGCQTYQDRAGTSVSAHRFSRLCSEKVVGCDRFFDTQNSTAGVNAPYGRVHNATCLYDTNGEALDGEVVDRNTDCIVDGQTYCTITVGRSGCRFDSPTPLPLPLPYDAESDFRLVLGPEAQMVPNDAPLYVVESASASCSVANVGCTEIGRPKFSQDKKIVTSFESAYYINHPDRYEGAGGKAILCEHEALFCEEWISSDDTAYYFKHPIDGQCEYKTSITIENQPFFGWFRSGTNEPCDWQDTNGNGRFDLGVDRAQLIGGSEFGIKRNGDIGYEGWVGVCAKQFDQCTEFLDPTDTAEGQLPNGTSYYFINNAAISEESIRATEKCQGAVSQKEGCVLFNDRNDSEAFYSAAPTYISSVHADELFGGEPDELVDPISCERVEDGEITTPSGERVNLCLSRCQYTLGDTGGLKVGNGVKNANRSLEFVGACFTDADCPVQEALEGTLLPGVCVTLAGDDIERARHHNDTNTVLKVKRDRTCAQWLACSSSQTSWDETQGKFVQICDSVDLCSEFGATGGEVCSKWVESEALVLTPERYSGRDISWSGLEFSGYSIPNQLPIEHQRQANVNPNKWCVSIATKIPAPGETGYGVRCNDTSTCRRDLGEGFECVDAAPDQRLVHIAGPCDEGDLGRGGQCFVGRCEGSSDACSNDTDCGRGDRCVVGACQFVIPNTTCSQDSQCNGGFCDFGRCVRYDPDNNDRLCFSSDQCGGDEQCIPNAQSKIGACFNDQCLTSIQADLQTGATRTIVRENGNFAVTAEGESCRGYPEPDAPYAATEIVRRWVGAPSQQNPEVPEFETASERPAELWSRPFETTFGFNNANTCAPISGPLGEDVPINNADCVCSYQKVSYDRGTQVRYYPNDLSGNSSTFNSDTDILNGICLGGDFAGFACLQDSDCRSAETSGGICIRKTSVEKQLGWTGFCIERDTSINIFNNPDKQACLTWLPVDQLSGSTDLFAKFTQAGFGPSDAYYCAETNTTYTIKSSARGNPEREGEGFACAETKDGACNNTEPDQGTRKFARDEDCWTGQHCPDGFFKVITGCDDGAPRTGPSDDRVAVCLDSDDDCPFFCVPKFSFHATDGSSKAVPHKQGQACVPPASREQGQSIGDQIGSQRFTFQGIGQLPTGNDGATEETYLVYDGSFFKASEHYNDCEVRGLTLETAARYFGPLRDVFGNGATFGGTSLNWYRGSRGSHTGHRNLIIPVEPILSCQSLVQVGSSNYDTEFSGFNSAWTDRTFAQKDFVQGSEQTQVNYRTGTAVSPFGVAVGKEAFLNSTTIKYDPRPEAVLHCRENINHNSAQRRLVLQSPDGACPANFSPVYEYSEARSYQLVEHQCNQTKDSIYCCTRLGEVDFEDDRRECQLFQYFEDDEEGLNRARCITSNGYEIEEIQQCEAVGIKPPGDTEVGAKTRLQQIFARAWRLFEWVDGTFATSGFEKLPGRQGYVPYEQLLSRMDSFTFGDYESVGLDEEDLWHIDGRTEGDPAGRPGFLERPSPPQIAAVGACEGTKCREGAAGKFSVNGLDEGTIEGDEGRKHVQVSFFAWADKDQLPIRNIIVDWGDGKRDAETSDPEAWPTSSQSGSRAKNNFYKNHRGARSGGGSECDGSEWGRTGDSCDTSYLNYTHNYVCTQDMVAGEGDDSRLLPVCDYEGDRLINSPCRLGNDVCVFQPRVHVVDNWGWCTGVCTSNPQDNSNSCYGKGEDFNSECNVAHCPGTGDPHDGLCPDSISGVTNPWVNFAGHVQVQPQVVGE